MQGPGAVDALQALMIVGGALLLLRLVLRRLVEQNGLGAKGRRMRHVESCPLGPKGRLHLVEVDGEELVVAATETQIQLLRRRVAPTRGTPAEPEAEEAPAPRRLGTEGARWIRHRLGGFLALALLAIAPEASAQSLGSELPNLVADATDPERISSTLELLLLLTLFSIAPSILLMATCFTRVVIVLSLLRQALGVAQLPPNQVIIGLALAITVFAMAPVGAEIEREALGPYVDNQIEAPVALDRATDTVRSFLLRHTRERDLALFVSLGENAPTGRDDVGLFTLLPSFMLSEIRTAFEIGFTIFLPFLIVDLVIASMLISMQMIVLPPIVISLPFKLMLFVLLDGWNLVAGSLIDGLR